MSDKLLVDGLYGTCELSFDVDGAALWIKDHDGDSVLIEAHELSRIAKWLWQHANPTRVEQVSHAIPENGGER